MNWTGYALLAVLMAVPASAQAQLRPPSAPTATRPVALPEPPPSSAAPRESRREDARPAAPPPAGKPKPAVPPPPARPIYDSKGQPAPYLRQTSPGRVLDTRTNRYYDTVPKGVGQQVVPPPAGTR
ncbi:classical arabinogalactan protein 4 [Stenotrophomonas mori]|uniref:Classical arabinogalactan protein 4 n=1 Tax=Stenotrophomonas mori TaxID=2871096 RepID=A0ABT0SJ26_9GAMM|nr:classical arabinogalactan protein 4 [Stenotrophomonas mori]MCL7715301.1 classical arabinogalactan protein 4 [Stenotrophomonas mori]